MHATRTNFDASVQACNPQASRFRRKPYSHSHSCIMTSMPSANSFMRLYHRSILNSRTYCAAKRVMIANYQRMPKPIVLKLLWRSHALFLASASGRGSSFIPAAHRAARVTTASRQKNVILHLSTWGHVEIWKPRAGNVSLMSLVCGPSWFARGG